MTRSVPVAIAFVRRDWLNESSYRALIIFEVINLIGSVVVFYAIGELVRGQPEALEPYGGKYFPFALVGLAVGAYFSVSLGSFSNRLRQAQMSGTLEAMLVTPVPGGMVLMFAGLWDFILATFRMCVYLLIGLTFLGVGFDVNIYSLVPLALLSLIAFAAAGLIVASAILVVKRGESIAAVVALLASIFGGLLFPVTLLPARIYPLHYVDPLYYSLDGLRRSLLVDAGPSAVLGDLIGITISAVGLSIMAWVAIRWALCQTRAEASLAQY